jgi:hypothetical protein
MRRLRIAHGPKLVGPSSKCTMDVEQVKSILQELIKHRWDAEEIRLYTR